MPTENNTDELRFDELSKLANTSDDNSNMTENSNKASSQPDMVVDLPVLAKDSYYLSRLERELARAAVAKNKKILTIKPMMG